MLMLGLPVTVFAVGAPFATYRWLIPSNPLDADMVQLGRWLVTYKVSDQPRDVQEKLVDRIQESLPGLQEVSSSTDYRLSAPQQQRLIANTTRLQRVWFELRSKQNGKMPQNAARVKFLREQVTTLLGLADLAKNVLSAAGGEPEDTDAMSEFLDNLEQWKEEAPPKTRQVMKDAVRDGLLVYLGYFDLSDLPIGEREVLALRVAKTLDTPGNSQLPPVRLTGSANASLQSNAELLLEAWFRVQAETYDQTEAPERPAFIEKLVDRIKGWNLGELLAGDGSDAAASQSKMLLRLQGQINVWIERASPDDQPKMKLLAAAVRQHLLWSSMKALMPSFGE